MRRKMLEYGKKHWNMAKSLEYAKNSEYSKKSLEYGKKFLEWKRNKNKLLRVLNMVY